MELLLVGLWTTLLYLVLPLQGYLLWFVLGFCKHGLAGIAGLHDMYCSIKGYSHTNHKNLFIESIGEGLLFLVAHLFLKDVWYSAFFLGCTLHFLFEILGLHTYFIKKHCIK